VSVAPPRLLVLDRTQGPSAPRGGASLAEALEVADRLDALTDGWSPRGTVAVVVGTTVREGGVVRGAWSDHASPGGWRRRTGGPVLDVPPGTLHLAVWSPSVDTWATTPPDRVCNRHARPFARALRATTGGRELLVREGGVVGCFGWAWGPTRGLTLEVFVAGPSPLGFVVPTPDPQEPPPSEAEHPAAIGDEVPREGSRVADLGAREAAARRPSMLRRGPPLAAGFPMRGAGPSDADGGEVLRRLVRELAARVSDVAVLREADLHAADRVPTTTMDPAAPSFAAPSFAAPYSAAPFPLELHAAPALCVAMGSLTCRARGGVGGLTGLRITGEIFRPDDLDARWSAALRGPWPSADHVVTTLRRIEAAAPVRPEGLPPLDELAASLLVAISLARDHAR
jgi:hypothetical protein